MRSTSSNSWVSSSHSVKDYDDPCSNVYTPSEDSFSVAGVADGVIWDANMACDLGCGAGVIAYALARRAGFVVATDISEAAVRCAKSRLARREGANIDFVQTEGLSAFRRESFDVIVSNPPYLDSRDGDVRWDGGIMGIEVPLKFAGESFKALEEKGLLIIAVSSLSPVKLFEECLKAYGYLIVYRAIAHIGLMEALTIFVAKKL